MKMENLVVIISIQEEVPKIGRSNADFSFWANIENEVCRRKSLSFRVKILEKKPLTRKFSISGKKQILQV